MKFENTHVYNFEGAIHGMRNPMNSWNRSDSYFGLADIYNTDALTDVCDAWIDKENEGCRERGVEEYSQDMEHYSEYYDVLDKYESWLTNQGILNGIEYENVYLSSGDGYIIIGQGLTEDEEDYLVVERISLT